jgi:ketopantoate reductase
VKAGDARAPKILLVGAGAVGQVYGYHLHRGGAQVTFYVRAKYREGLAQDGMPLYPLKGRDKGKCIEFRDFGLVSTPAEVAAQGPFDQVWLCMSSTALKGDWLEPLLAVVGEAPERAVAEQSERANQPAPAAERRGNPPDSLPFSAAGATVVSLQPGLEDGPYLRARMPAERLVQGLIPMISYQTPLPTETRNPPGIAFYTPPGKNPFSGPRVGPVVAALKAGGWASKAVPDVARVTALGSAMMIPVIAGLEVGGWRFKAFGRGDGVRLASAALAQTTQIAVPGFRRALIWLFRRPWTLRFVLFMGERVLPLPLEVYLQYHFTKVADQTRAQLHTFIERGRAAGQPTEAVEALLHRLPPLE